jgi:hypothetical protein
MAHFAKMNGDIVEFVIVVNNDVINNLPFPASESIGIAFCKTLYAEDTEWLQTSYNNSFRKWFAGSGFTYDSTKDAFIPPKPYPSWIFDETIWYWQAPIPYPTDNKVYEWNETTQSWDLVDA